MKLEKLLEGIYLGSLNPQHKNIEVLSISCDSRKVMPGSFFVALKGHMHNGADYVENALARGAFAVVADSDLDDIQAKNPDICFLHVEHIQDFLHRIVQKLYGYDG